MMGRTGARLYLACIVAAVLLGSISLRAEERPKTTAADAETKTPISIAIGDISHICATVASSRLNDLPELKLEPAPSPEKEAGQ